MFTSLKHIYALPCALQRTEAREGQGTEPVQQTVKLKQRPEIERRT